MDREHGATYAGCDSHLLEYWEEYQKMIEETKILDDYLDEECSPRSYDEGEEEAEWLRAAGLEQLTEAWKAGREVQPEELGVALRPLSRVQAEVVKRRVRSLNHTVKQRFNQRQRIRKPDIRDVFKDVEVSSTGTRSRSATPDSLDSIRGATPENASPPSPPTVTVIEDVHQNASVPSFVSMFHRTSNEGKVTVRRTPSVPQTVLNSIPVSTPTSVPVQEIFRRTGNWSRGNVANDSEGIQLTGYHRLGTIHIARPIQRHNNDINDVANFDAESVRKLTVPKESTLRRSSGNHTAVTRSHSSLYGLTRPADGNLIARPLSRTSSHGHLSFEEMCKTNEAKSQVWSSDSLMTDDDYARQDVELLSQRDFTKLQPLLWLELTAIFDKYNIPLTRRKPNKRRRKTGNLFGVSLSTLLLRDSQLTSEENNIPLVFQKILNELTKRGIKEEGILRVGGHKQKVEIICIELETDFYCKPKEMDKLFKHTPCHDLSAVLKKLLRDLPQPLLTIELIDAFYQSHGVKNPNDLVYSLNLLVLLLPVEHRCTLEALLNFLKLVIENQASNKMSIHNVAMIVAPSLFPPRYVHPRDHTDLTAQVNMAAICCQVTEALLNNVDKLWYVPMELINQLRRQSEVDRYRKYKKKYF
ncbi:rho GTPase-activating protein conundrum [Monomorium pharaonis]|uniref:rho GTPase-activating protein conundrum n=1 Tax=Monomorium pharaonis TaxID=307658 RepID=UPI00063EF91B|nr:rho GTPase-activating protein conundrum [Monomorium pharaonis]XP_012542197.1 rho GTPase-activating protein conundrum [Monomorium pharaonis]XP_012542198.1 rho GTPase-activating protein conundrum [Monomorium pharaonis]XP_012542200.1 rho GTPase-activating protein conundrum [Monomorium pharaonis]XP_028046392.1 rho GTPase-activating protein conundrum [Monomorium pharaonis]XP_036143976.1 rho GTPase-activating protein conundrum [Monomorium pharaonis]XP_036143977.1 rho GTPase-activating protein co